MPGVAIRVIEVAPVIEVQVVQFTKGVNSLTFISEGYYQNTL